MDDFRKLSIFGKHVERKRSLLTQDKGHAKSWDTFIKAIISNKKEPIDYQELITSSYAALACDHAMKTGKPVNITEFIENSNE